MKNLSKILFFALFVGSLSIYLTSCDKSDPILENVTDVNFENSDIEGLVPEEEIDKFIMDWISTHRTAFDWDNAPDEMLYSALMYGDSILTISFKVGASTDKREFYRQNRKLPSNWVKEREDIIDYVLSEEKSYRNNTRLAAPNLLPFGRDNELAVINIKITNPLTISNLRSKYHVNLDPPSYIPASFGRKNPPLTGSPDVGCHPEQELIQSSDLSTNININAPHLNAFSSSSWNYDIHGIRDAWACTQGTNIEVCVIDTGVSDNQPNLQQINFDPDSIGRTIEKHVDLRNLEGPCLAFGELEVCPPYPRNDECGHGTGMAGVIGAPSESLSLTGVAYNANLFPIKATHDVIVWATDEVRGVRDALMTAKNRKQTRIISMSIGRPTVSNLIAEALIAVGSTDKLIFAAAGTSTWLSNNFPFVIFPASDIHTLAVTGENSTTGEICSNCHFGVAVDFTAIMEKGSTVSTAIGPVTLANEPGMKYTSGSSCATATVAGIAALVWSKYPDENSTSILNRLMFASSNYDANVPDFGRNDVNGWGYINVFDAVEQCN